MSKELISKKNRALLAELVRTDFKLRYQGSILGYAWSLLRPLFLFLILYVVFTQFLRLGKGIPHYPVYLLLGIVLWQFFADMTTQSLGSVVARGDLIRKIRIPRWMIVVTSSVSSLISLGFNMIIILGLMIINQVSLSSSIIWLPIVIVEIYVFALGLSLLLSASFVKYRDVSFIWEVLMQAGFYLTPIIYPLTAIKSITVFGTTIASATIHKVLLINPIAQAIQDARNIMVTKDSITITEVWGSSFARFIPFVIGLLILLLGIFYFKKESKYFAENL